jgi:TRAP-type uncharacterized transport system substrate-binding protein
MIYLSILIIITCIIITITHQNLEFFLDMHDMHDGRHAMHDGRHAMHDGRAMIPFESPFNPGFFKVKEKVTTMGIIDNGFDKQILSMFIPGANIQRITTNVDLINAVESGKIDFAVVLEDILHSALNGINYFKNKKFMHIRHVASLHSALINIICPANMGITDLGDIIKHDGKIRLAVGTKNSLHHISAIEILRYLELEGKVNYYFSSDQDIVRAYGAHEVDMIYYISNHPSLLIKSASNKRLSHFVSINALNNGDILNYTLTEQDFYQSDMLYTKALIDLNELIPRIYPKMAITNNLKLYIPTIKSKYILITRDNVSDITVSRVLGKIIKYMSQSPDKKSLFLKSITLPDLIYTRTTISYHPAVEKIYRKRNLISNEATAHCMFYVNGHCPSVAPAVLSFKKAR